MAKPPAATTNTLKKLKPKEQAEVTRTQPSSSPFAQHGWGLCNSKGFTIEGKDGAGLKVTKEGFSVNAFRRGKLVKTEGSMKLPEDTYREKLRFANISSITLKEPGLMTTTCGRKESQTEAAIRETFVRWYAALIPTAEKEGFIAAFLKLRPDVEIDEQ